MEHINRLVITFILISSISSAKRNDFNIVLEPRWKNLEKNEQNVKTFGGKWVLVGSITFKKKSKECVNLRKLHLQWNGVKIDYMNASLYRKRLDKKFYPIQDFLVCDGIWNKNKQTLLLNFDKQCALGPIDTFFLVLTVPPQQEALLKMGSFKLVNQCLPQQFEHCLINQNLSLSLNNSTHKN